MLSFFKRGASALCLGLSLQLSHAATFSVTASFETSPGVTVSAFDAVLPTTSMSSMIESFSEVSRWEVISRGQTYDFWTASDGTVYGYQDVSLQVVTEFDRMYAMKDYVFHKWTFEHDGSGLANHVDLTLDVSGATALVYLQLYGQLGRVSVPRAPDSAASVLPLVRFNGQVQTTTQQAFGNDWSQYLEHRFPSGAQLYQVDNAAQGLLTHMMLGAESVPYEMRRVMGSERGITIVERHTVLVTAVPEAEATVMAALGTLVAFGVARRRQSSSRAKAALATSLS
jgi:hypothetical protein